MSNTTTSISLIELSLSDKKSPRVLDLGCGAMEFAMELLERFENIKTVCCVDDDRDNKIKDSMLWIPKNERFDSTNYKTILKDYYRDSKDLIDKMDFRDKDIVSFLKEEKEKFNLVLLKNVLHFFVDGQERINLLNSIGKLLTNQGQIYISVANEKHNYKNQEDRSTFNRNQLLQEIRKTDLIFVSNPIKIDTLWHFMLKNKTS